MTLYKIEDFHPNYRENTFEGEDIKGLRVFANQTNQQIGTVDDVLVDENGRFRYFVINTGAWIFGKKFLLPVGRCHIDPNRKQIQTIGLQSKEQIENLPEYHDNMTVDQDYEERIYYFYRVPNVENSVPVEMSTSVEQAARIAAVPVEMSSPVEGNNVKSVTKKTDVVAQTPNRDRRHIHTYEREPSMYQVNEQAHQQFKLYEERLVADKHRQRTGEVTVGKQVEAKTATVSVPVQKERVVIEHRQPSSHQQFEPDQTQFQAGEVARIEVFEETADIDKETFVREEVNIKKIVEQDTIHSQETIRREKLDVQVEENSPIKE